MVVPASELGALKQVVCLAKVVACVWFGEFLLGPRHQEAGGVDHVEASLPANKRLISCQQAAKRPNRRAAPCSDEGPPALQSLMVVGSL